MLFFHVEQLRYVVIELKTGKFKPEYLGQLGFYVALVDDKLRRPPARRHRRTTPRRRQEQCRRPLLTRRTPHSNRSSQLRPPPTGSASCPAL
ncbi:PDDEXK nuclease domain-containing protein [Curtobacterium sp. MCPF17_052]|uniref:PDDEXK nuclease domain-containing protein n=1 Tax=Curtobacterium sp. MCPF17_052 TaxID=2175655 RepID=UPI00346490BC